MRIVCFSDTHRNMGAAIDAVLSLKEVDVIIHLGDNVSDAEEIRTVFPDIKMISVRGNNDYESYVPDFLTVELGGKKFFLTHGHMYGVKSSLCNLANKVLASGADVGLFGHTHKPYDDYFENTHLINPGKSAFNYLGEATCAVIEIENSKLKSMIWQIK